MGGPRCTCRCQHYHNNQLREAGSGAIPNASFAPVDPTHHGGSPFEPFELFFTDDLTDFRGTQLIGEGPAGDDSYEGYGRALEELAENLTANEARGTGEDHFHLSEVLSGVCGLRYSVMYLVLDQKGGGGNGQSVGGNAGGHVQEKAQARQVVFLC